VAGEVGDIYAAICGQGLDVKVTSPKKGAVHVANNLYPSPNIITVITLRRMRWVGHVARMGERTHACKTLVEEPEGKRPVGRLKRRWEDNIRMHLREIGWKMWTGCIWLRIGTSGGLL
jgi:hypothetical protein